ncbi:MAG: exonuclease SbcCD subunit D [Schaedlerella sp.]|nr:exonuclease SbcCD subunit D [Schaedlerella sp.]
MKFFHLSDLHIGKHLHYYNLKEDQQHILKEVIDYAESIKPDAIVIAGDIYDKSVPSAEAVTIFDEFLTALAKLAIPVLMIAGNHDSAERLDYASQILGSHNIFIVGRPPEVEDEYIKKIVLKDEYGEVDFYLLPFLKPGYVRNIFEEKPENYSDAVKKIIEREQIDWTRRNVLVSHQFYIGNGETPSICDSENISVGGIDQVDISSVKNFDYVALGHLHGAQKVSIPQIRYSGTLLKYSVSESAQEKILHIVTLEEKEKDVVVEKLPLHPLRDVRKIRGNLAEVIENALPENKTDYVSITLTDEVEPYKPKEQLEKVYTHILEIRMDNTRTRKMLEDFQEEITVSDPLRVFSDFYKEMQGKEMSKEEHTVIARMIEDISDM